MLDRNLGGGGELLHRPAGSSGERVPSCVQAGCHAAIRPVPEQGHGVASVGRDGAECAVPWPVGREDDNLRGAFARVAVAGTRGSKLDEDRSGILRRAPLGEGPDPSCHGDDTRTVDPAQPLLISPVASSALPSALGSVLAFGAPSRSWARESMTQ